MYFFRTGHIVGEASPWDDLPRNFPPGCKYEISHVVACLGKLQVRDGASDAAADGTAEFGDALTGGRGGQDLSKADKEKG